MRARCAHRSSNTPLVRIKKITISANRHTIQPLVFHARFDEDEERKDSGSAHEIMYPEASSKSAVLSVPICVVKKLIQDGKRPDGPLYTHVDELRAFPCGML